VLLLVLVLVLVLDQRAIRAEKRARSLATVLFPGSQRSGCFLDYEHEHKHEHDILFSGPFRAEPL